MPDGIRRRMVFLPPITSVWPALCPPWNRTTPCAWSVSQSTILPLPSSPHWVPITTTFLAISVQFPYLPLFVHPGQFAVTAPRTAALMARQFDDDHLAPGAQALD